MIAGTVNKLTPNEIVVIQMALQVFIEDMQEMSTNQKAPFTPEARKMQKEMSAAAKSALDKIATASGHAVQLDPYQEDDETEFLTKQS